MGCIMALIHLMSLDGMVVVIHISFRYMILSPSPAGFISPRPYTKHLKPMPLWFVHLCRGYMITIPMPSRLPIITVILTVTNYCTM